MSTNNLSVSLNGVSRVALGLNVAGEVDLSLDSGPLQYLMAKKALRNAQEGQAVKILLNNDNHARIIVNGLQQVGFVLDSVEESNPHYIACLSKPEGY